MGEAATLDQVVGAYLAKPGSRRQSVYRELGDIAAKLTVKIPEPLLQLASIRDLNLFASFCTDNLLAQAINAVRFGGRAETRELAFNPSEAGDLPDGARDVPVVYSLFGRMSVLPKYVIAEEDELEWVTALQIPEKRPERLFDELGHNHLLFLGCGFPDWLARFILRTAKNSKLSAERGFSEYLIDADEDSNSPLVVVPDQLQPRNRGDVGGPFGFVAELARRWQERKATTALPKNRSPARCRRPCRPAACSSAMPARIGRLRCGLRRNCRTRDCRCGSIASNSIGAATTRPAFGSRSSNARCSCPCFRERRNSAPDSFARNGRGQASGTWTSPEAASRFCARW